VTRSGTERLEGKRVAIYARYSSANQREASLDDQIHRCSEFITRRGGLVPPELVFGDKAVSGASLQRPAFERLWRLVESKKIDVIVTEDASRITREFADSAVLFRDLAWLEVPLLGVADGIDTSRKNAKLDYGIKSLMNDVYREDLRDKTKRGLDGRARAGFSTGGSLFGYRTRPVQPNGRLIGHEVVIDQAQAETVRRIFRMYAEGQSYESIARQLTSERVGTPRPNSHRRLKGWVPGTIRDFLSNESYIGNWSYGDREWRKPPGSNSRRYRNRPEEEVHRAHYADRIIIDQDLWDTVQERRRVTAARYGKGQKAGGAVSPGPRSHYVLSGLLTCGVCGGNMAVSGGSSAAYYRCTGAKKRGSCSNRLSQREDVAAQKILAAVREILMSPENIIEMRRTITEKLSKVSHAQDRELKAIQERLQDTEVKIRNLIATLSEGFRSEAIRQSLQNLERQAEADRKSIAALKQSAQEALILPHPSMLVDRALNLDDMFRRDPVAGREALGHLLGGQTISLRPDPAGHYVAEATIFPLLPLESGSSGNLRGTAIGCAGRI
jgi:site-specific DNA recombinase